MSTATPPLALSGTPKATIAVGCVAALAVAIAAGNAAWSRGAPRTQVMPLYLPAMAAPALDAAPGEARTAVIYSADGRSRVTITVEEVAASPVSSPIAPDEFAPEAEVRHAAARP